MSLLRAPVADSGDLKFASQTWLQLPRCLLGASVTRKNTHVWHQTAATCWSLDDVIVSANVARWWRLRHKGIIIASASRNQTHTERHSQTDRRTDRRREGRETDRRQVAFGLLDSWRKTNSRPGNVRAVKTGQSVGKLDLIVRPCFISLSAHHSFTVCLSVCLYFFILS